MYEHVVRYGRMFNEIDDEMGRNVCVIGTGVRDELFGSPEDAGEEINPVGETININGQPFTIIGMFEHYESEQERKERELAKLQPKQDATGPKRSRGWSGRGGRGAFRMKNNTLFMPLNTVWLKFRAAGAGAPGGGSRSAGASAGAVNAPDPRLSGLEVKIADVDHINRALQQILNVLMSTHKGIEDFSFRTQEEWVEEIDAFVHNARISGGIIAGISLLVGGIGIMNIMLASISERVREIGIRKAVGAATGDVFIQILVESVVIAVLGGRVKVSVQTRSGREILLAIKEPGDLVGELSAIDSRPRSATAIALEPVDALVVTAPAFVEFIEGHPRIAVRLLRTLAAQIRDADRRSVDRDTGDITCRVARRLVDLAERLGEYRGSGVEVTLVLGQDDLAAWVGATREATSRALGRLRAEGWLTTARQRIVLTDLPALRRRASEPA